MVNKNKESLLKKTILLVEDDEDAQVLGRIHLQTKYTVFTVASVKEAKTKLQKESVDLILLDLALKGDEDGLELVKFIRKSKEWSDLPIVALTAHAYSSDQRRCIDAGCNEFLSKPIKWPLVLERINPFI